MSSFHTLYFKDLSMISFSCAGIPGSVLYQEANRSLWLPHPLLFLNSLLLQAAFYFLSAFVK